MSEIKGTKEGENAMSWMPVTGYKRQWMFSCTTADVITRVRCRVPIVVTVRSIVGHLISPANFPGEPGYDSGIV
jgi:hypothetical protein